MCAEQLLVKVYVVRGDGQLDHIGTGHVLTIYNEQLHCQCLLVQSDSDDSKILESEIRSNTLYRKKQGTSIVWSDSENVSRALSFQDPESCQKIWKEICRIQGKDPSVEVTEELLDKTGQSDEMLETSNLVEPPKCEINTIGDLADFFQSFLVSSTHKERLLLILKNGNYIQKLLQLFQTCETLQNIEGLHHLYNIVKEISFLDNTPLFEIMFSDECIMDVVGCLEYDPADPHPKRHRQFLTENAKLKEVIPITNSVLRQKIHQTYRIQYIYDILLPTPSMYEHNHLPSLTNFIFLNKTEIVNMLQEDGMFLSEVFTQLSDKTMDNDKRRELLFFFKEFCEFSETLYPQSKDTLLKTLIKLGILPALKIVISMDDFQIKTAATIIFAYLVEYNPSIIRQFVVDETQESKDDELLINVVIAQMISDTDPEISGAMNLMEPLRSLLNPDNMLISSFEYERYKFLNFFYEHCMHNLIAPLLSTTEKDSEEEDDRFGLDKNKTCPSAVRFMREIINVRDEQYNRYIIQGNLFEPVVNAFLANGHRYNILNSAIIELFEYISVQNIKSLVAHVVENFYMAFELIEYVQTFKRLKTKYKQEKHRQGQARMILHSTLCKDTKVMKVKEEMHLKQNMREAVLPPMGNSSDGDEKLSEDKSTKENEDKVDLPKGTSSGVVRFSSSCSDGAGDAMSIPHSSRVSTATFGPHDNKVEEDEDKTSPNKRPHFSS
ncbi:protein PPP4R3C [Fukomys damarensis]|uniref:protein PPP4R3C n=1 Tax=Fukomys damarensis TaxID=885580 RepID=UPI000540101E|nr:protein PPP4R3C [Fukomys damarensis]